MSQNSMYSSFVSSLHPAYHHFTTLLYEGLGMRLYVSNCYELLLVYSISNVSITDAQLVCIET